ncbi:hypothetical protein HanRHA438_Chr11g0485311 [Helianthus annuus]|nr:hypothetical protein HanRHA438_Chr11g0485311 [Helianthus annuus]
MMSPIQSHSLLTIITTTTTILTIIFFRTNRNQIIRNNRGLKPSNTRTTSILL